MHIEPVISRRPQCCLLWTKKLSKKGLEVTTYLCLKVHISSTPKLYCIIQNLAKNSLKRNRPFTSFLRTDADILLHVQRKCWLSTQSIAKHACYTSLTGKPQLTSQVYGSAAGNRASGERSRKLPKVSSKIGQTEAMPAEIIAVNGLRLYWINSIFL